MRDLIKAGRGLRWFSLMMSLVLCVGSAAQEYFEEDADSYYADFTQGEEGDSFGYEETAVYDDSEGESEGTYEDTEIYSSYDYEVDSQQDDQEIQSYQEPTQDYGYASATQAPVQSASTSWPASPDITAATAVIVEDANNVVLYSKNAQALQDPGGTVKIMTALLAIENGNMDEKVEMTSTSTSGVTEGGLTISAQVGEVFTMEQLIYSVVLAGANDAALQIAEKVGGSVPAFVEKMNARAKELGCTNTNFANPTGLEDTNQLSTGHDLALIMQVAIENPTFMRIAKTKAYTIPATNMSGGERVLTNSFEMLRTPLLDNVEVLGGKQGYTQTSGNTLVWAAKRDERVLIFLLLQGSADSMDYDAMSLMDYGFNQLSLVNLGDEDFDIVSGGNVSIPDGYNTELLTTQDSLEGEKLVRRYYLGETLVGQAEVDHVEGESAQTKRDGVYYLEEAKTFSEKKSILPYILILVVGLALIVLFVRRFGPFGYEYDDEEEEDEDEEEEIVAPPVRKKSASSNTKKR